MRFFDWGMKTMHAKFKIATAAAVAIAAMALSNPASARHRLYPLTQCGPNLDHLCPLHGSFEGAPFHYNLAIHPSCIKTVPVQTAYGIERRRAVVCGAPAREMIWWW